jgi:hypothetical protein
VTARRAGAIALAAALALHAASPAAAGPLRPAIRFVVRQAVRFVEARQAIARARDLRDRVRETMAPTWRSVVAIDSSTAPQCPRTTPEPRPRGPQR